MADTTAPGPSAGDSDDDGSWRDAFDFSGDTQGDGGGVLGWDTLYGALPTGDTSQETLSSFFSGPRSFIRSVIASEILRGIAFMIAPIIAALVFVVGGSKPLVFAAPNETFGLADIPVWFAMLVGDLVSQLVSLYIGTLTGFLDGLMPEMPGPIDELITFVAALIVTALVLEGIRRVTLALVLGVADLDPTGITTAVLTALGVNK